MVFIEGILIARRELDMMLERNSFEAFFVVLLKNFPWFFIVFALVYMILTFPAAIEAGGQTYKPYIPSLIALVIYWPCVWVSRRVEDSWNHSQKCRVIREWVDNDSRVERNTWSAYMMEQQIDSPKLASECLQCFAITYYGTDINEIPKGSIYLAQHALGVLGLSHQSIQSALTEHCPAVHLVVAVD